MDLAEDYARVGATIYRLGDVAEALPYFQKALDLRRELVETYLTSPDLGSMSELQRRQRYHRTLQADFARSLVAVGEMTFYLGDKQTGRQRYREALGMLDEMLREHPKDIKLKHEIARISGNCGELQDDDLAARKHLERGRELMQELVDQDAKTVEFRRDLGLMHYRLGKLDLKVKDETAARDHLNKCREIRESLAAGDPTNIRRQIELMKVLPLCGDHERATAIAESLARGTSPDNELLVDIVICYAECAASVLADPERKSAT